MPAVLTTPPICRLPEVALSVTEPPGRVMRLSKRRLDPVRLRLAAAPPAWNAAAPAEVTSIAPVEVIDCEDPAADFIQGAARLRLPPTARLPVPSRKMPEEASACTAPY